MARQIASPEYRPKEELRSKAPFRPVLISRKSNYRAAFCDRTSPDGAHLPLADVCVELDRAAPETERLVLVGGEPLLHPELLALIGHARSRGPRVALETNATLLTSETVRTLRDAGLDAVYVTVAAVESADYLRIHGEQTALEQLFAGIDAAIEGGVVVTFRLPVAVGLPSPGARLEHLHARYPAASFELALVGHGEKTVEPGQALAAEAAAAQCAEAWSIAARHGAYLTSTPDHVLAPCVTLLPPEALGLFAGQLRSDAKGPPNAAAPECARCSWSKHCALHPDQLARAAGALALTPRHDAPGRAESAPTRAPRDPSQPYKRFKVLGADDVDRFFHVDYEYGAADVPIEHPTSRVGIIYKCNQDCVFCQLAEMNTYIPAEKVRAALERSYARGSRRVIITGGEPTLSPDLLSHVRYARELGFVVIELQTNAVVIDKPGFAERLREAGLTHAQISLHGPSAAVSDRLTAAPGTHQRTLAGVDNLLRVGVNCLLNHLIFRDNFQLLGEFVELAASRWGPWKDHLVLQFHAPLNEFEHREEALKHLARYTEYAGALGEAIDRARSYGLSTRDLQDPTGVPALCVMDSRHLGQLLSQQQRPRFHAWESDWLTRVEACGSCSAAELCMGVPKHYVRLFGDEEFHPIARDRVST